VVFLLNNLKTLTEEYGIRLEPQKNPDYWFSKYNRVLLHYSVSIAAAAATVAYIPLSAAAVYKPDRILWCYGEYQTLYGTVEGIEFQQGLPIWII
jgi:hypothetical protein